VKRDGRVVNGKVKYWLRQVKIGTIPVLHSFIMETLGILSYRFSRSMFIQVLVKPRAVVSSSGKERTRLIL
jgi:hypothetical protein